MLPEKTLDEALEEMIQRRVQDQKKFYKNSKVSLCQNCTRVNEDCGDFMKSCGKDDKTGFSTVGKCTGFKNKNPIEW